jgi:HD-like signal output (HDOD) protein
MTDKKCSSYIEEYIRFLLSGGPASPRVNSMKEHIRNCTYCKSNLSVFSTIIEKRLSQNPLSPLSCGQIERLAADPAGLTPDHPARQDVLDHLISCKPCRDRFVDRFVMQIEKDSSVFNYALDIPELKSPMMLLEIRQGRKNEVKEAIRTAEASIIRIKPDGGMKYGLNDLIEKRIESLPPYPDNVRQIVELIDNDADLIAISGEISKDVSLTARILQIANSPYYRGNHPTEDIQRGLSRIGLKSISRIVKVFGVHSVIMGQAGKYLAGYDIPMKTFMNYSAMLAVISMLLAPKYDPKLIKAAELSFEIDMVAYTAGLVSNLGMIVLDHCIDRPLREGIKERVGRGMEITAIEQELFGITHPEVSARILKKWNLSESFINSIVAHHASGQAARPDDLLSNILFAADTIASDFLRPASRIRPFLNIIRSEDQFLGCLPFASKDELSAFYVKELLPAFESHRIEYDKNLFV